MQTPLIGKPRSYRPIRLSNWDLLRSHSIFLTSANPLVVHPSACPLFSCRALLELAI